MIDALLGSDTPIRDILLPRSDRIALIEALVVLSLTIIGAWLVRRERALLQLVAGAGLVALGLMAMRALH